MGQGMGSPLFYETTIIRSNLALSSYSNRIQRLSPDFVAQNVKNFCSLTSRKTQLLRLTLSLLPGLQAVALTHRLTPHLKFPDSVRLKTFVLIDERIQSLSSSRHAYDLDHPFSHPAFSDLTHLRLGCLQESFIVPFTQSLPQPAVFPSTQHIEDGAIILPRLTHLAFTHEPGWPKALYVKDMLTADFCSRVLEFRESLRVLVVCVPENRRSLVDEHKEFEMVQDSRFYIYSEPSKSERARAEDWYRHVNGGKSLWHIAEELKKNC